MVEPCLKPLLHLIFPSFEAVEPPLNIYNFLIQTESPPISRNKWPGVWRGERKLDFNSLIYQFVIVGIFSA